MNDRQFYELLEGLARKYPAGMVQDQLRDVPRIAYNIAIGLRAVGTSDTTNLRICDLGGGVGLFSAGCASLGFGRVVLVDDFSDGVNLREGGSVLDLHRSLGVAVVARDVVESGIADIEGPFDIITCFDSMEHWHHSPKGLFRQVVEKLRPGGAFVLAVPNSVNLRKRLSVPLGYGKWSSMADWYAADRFRGHVREPDVGDLRYIARDMGLTSVEIHGRNWQGYNSGNPAIRVAASLLDRPLQLFPSLCAALYLVGRRPI